MWSLSTRRLWRSAAPLLNCNKKCPYRFQTAYFTDSCAVSINSTFPPSVILLSFLGMTRFFYGKAVEISPNKQIIVIQWELMMITLLSRCQHAETVVFWTHSHHPVNTLVSSLPALSTSSSSWSPSSFCSLLLS